MKIKSAVAKINRNGALLVYPVKNAAEPRSLWSEFFPKKEMRWEWTDDGDDGVAEMWHLMKRLSDSREVVYTKWYQGRATFFSRDLFTAMLRVRRKAPDSGLCRDARKILNALEFESPLSTKELKRVTDLQGRFNEGDYSRAMKELFQRLLIVAFGEVDDGAFPSLAVGATKLLYEDLWMADLSLDEAGLRIERHLPAGSRFRNFFERTRRDCST